MAGGKMGDGKGSWLTKENASRQMAPAKKNAHVISGWIPKGDCNYLRLKIKYPAMQ